MIPGLIDSYSSFATSIKINGKEVVDGKIVSFNQSLLIKSAYAETGNDVTIEVPANGDNSSNDRDKNCVGKADGSYCMSYDYTYECKNGKEVSFESCGLYKTCSNGECICNDEPCYKPGYVKDPDTCKCGCPKGTYWDGSECVEKECDDVSDCIGWFSDLDAECLTCENHKCKTLQTVCEGERVLSCFDGKRTSSTGVTVYKDYCNPDRNLECVDGECECVDDDMCQIGLNECTGPNTFAKCLNSLGSSGGQCPYWKENTCEEGGECDEKTGQCKYHECTPGEKKCSPILDTEIIECDESGKWRKPVGNPFQKGNCNPYCEVCSNGGCVRRHDLPGIVEKDLSGIVETYCQCRDQGLIMVGGKAFGWAICCEEEHGPVCGDICCPMGQICSNGHCCNSNETWATEDKKCCSNVSAGHCCGSDEEWVEN